MEFQPAIWNLLHDGSIIAIQGSLPGTLLIDVSIPYLRERFPDSGDTIRVALHGCSRLAYREYGSEALTADLAVISSMTPEILGAEMRDGLCEVSCDRGVLELVAERRV